MYGVTVTFLFSKFRAFFSTAEIHALNGASISATVSLSEFLQADGIIITAKHETLTEHRIFIFNPDMKSRKTDLAGNNIFVRQCDCSMPLVDATGW